MVWLVNAASTRMEADVARMIFFNYSIFQVLVVRGHFSI